MYENANPTVSHNVIMNNDNAGIQSGTEVYSPSFGIYNNIFMGNQIALSALGDERPQVRCNDLWSNNTKFQNYPNAYGNATTTNRNGDPSDAFANIFLDPRFVDQSAQNFHISPHSPAMDAGCYHSDAYLTDIDGEPRPQHTAFDLGIDELPDDSPVARVERAADRSSQATGQTLWITATVIGKEGDNVANQLVTFSTDRGLLVDGIDSQVTNAAGMAGIQVTSQVTDDVTFTATADFRQGQTTISFYPGPPPVPSPLTATALTDHEVELTWADRAWDETEYQIERSPNGSYGWTNTAAVGADVTTYRDKEVDCNAYYYRVRAYRARDGSYSTYSNAAQDESGLCPPHPLSLTNYSPNWVSLRWQYEAPTLGT